MRIEELRAARRPDADWEPFMHRLGVRMRRERQARVLPWAAAAALVAVAVGGFWLLPRHASPRPTLRADIPSLSSPVFTPSAGTAFAVADGSVVVVPEVRT
jgi:hypothetical protein